MRRLALVLLAVLVLAACGSTHKKTHDDKALITSAYERFFSAKTTLANRVALLQNGQKFKPLVKTFASNPLAQGVTAAVTSVTLEGANRAKVVYAVKLGGTSLPKQTGTAVKQNGQWKVGSGSLCRLIALGGTTPSACKS